MTDEKKEETPVSKPKKVVPLTKSVRNMGKNKVELIVDGKVLSIFPGQTCEVPKDLEIPQGINLFERI